MFASYESQRRSEPRVRRQPACELRTPFPRRRPGLQRGSVDRRRRALAPCRRASFDVLVIDDGSTDRTAELAAAAGAPVVSLPFNLGIGGAVQTAFIFALENGYDYMAQVDGDGQHDAAELVKLIEVMDSDRRRRGLRVTLPP